MSIDEDKDADWGRRSCSTVTRDVFPGMCELTVQFSVPLGWAGCAHGRHTVCSVCRTVATVPRYDTGASVWGKNLKLLGGSMMISDAEERTAYEYGFRRWS